MFLVLKRQVNTPIIGGPRTVIEKETFNFSCMGSPPNGVLMYTWLKDGSIIGNGSHFTRTARKNDTGRYLCEVKYVTGSVISSAPRTLLVHCKYHLLFVSCCFC